MIQKKKKIGSNMVSWIWILVVEKSLSLFASNVKCGSVKRGC